MFHESPQMLNDLSVTIFFLQNTNNRMRSIGLLQLFRMLPNWRTVVWVKIILVNAQKKKNQWGKFSDRDRGSKSVVQIKGVKARVTSSVKQNR